MFSNNTLVAGAMRYARQMVGVDRHLIKQPAGWLHDERWDDETATARTIHGEPVVRQPVDPAKMAAYTARLAAENGIATA